MIDEDGGDDGDDALDQDDEEGDGEQDACGAGDLCVVAGVDLVEAGPVISNVLVADVGCGEEGCHEEDPAGVDADAPDGEGHVHVCEPDDGEELGEDVKEEDADEGVEGGAGCADLWAIEIVESDGEDGGVSTCCRY